MRLITGYLAGKSPYTRSYTVCKCTALANPTLFTPQLDVVDPGTLLMWIFGLIISVLWLLLVFNCE